jgi:nitrate reductase NapE component
MTEENTTLYCYVHPNRETTLRCNHCERPICADCAVLTPTGYRCKECVRDQQRIFDTAEWYDYVLGFIIASVLSAIASFLVTFIGGIGFIGWFLIIAAGPVAGIVIAEGVRSVTRRHRAKPLYYTVLAGVILGALPVLLTQLFIMNLFGILFQVIYLAITVPTVYTRLSGIQLTR